MLWYGLSEVWGGLSTPSPHRNRYTVGQLNLPIVLARTEYTQSANLVDPPCMYEAFFTKLNEL